MTRNEALIRAKVTLWLMPHSDHQSVIADAIEAAFKEGAKESARLRAEVDRLTRERDDLKHECDTAYTIAENCRKDRAAVLNVKTTDGLTSSEWLMRTAIAEQERDAARAALVESSKLVDAVGVWRAWLAGAEYPAPRDGAEWQGMIDAHDNALAAVMQAAMKKGKV